MKVIVNLHQSCSCQGLYMNFSMNFQELYRIKKAIRKSQNFYCLQVQSTRKHRKTIKIAYELYINDDTYYFLGAHSVGMLAIQSEDVEFKINILC